MKEKIGDRPVIAEDLGFLTPTVKELLEQTGYPGMKVLQFAFDSREESDYLPHNYTANSVVYTGTHDNDTTQGWYRVINDHDRSFADKYLNIKEEEEAVWTFVRAALSSVSDTAVIPMQDYLGLGTQARINVPSTLGNNWKWRMQKGQTNSALAEKIRDVCRLYGRAR